MADLTPERIAEAGKRRAELIIEDVTAAQAERHISAFENEARGVARDYLALLSESSEREKALREYADELEQHDYHEAADEIRKLLAGSPSEKPDSQ